MDVTKIDITKIDAKDRNGDKVQETTTEARQSEKEAQKTNEYEYLGQFLDKETPDWHQVGGGLKGTFKSGKVRNEMVAEAETLNRKALLDRIEKEKLAQHSR